MVTQGICANSFYHVSIARTSSSNQDLFDVVVPLRLMWWGVILGIGIVLGDVSVDTRVEGGDEESMV